MNHRRKRCCQPPPVAACLRPLIQAAPFHLPSALLQVTIVYKVRLWETPMHATPASSLTPPPQSCADQACCRRCLAAPPRPPAPPPQFGGSSVASAERMMEVADIVCSFPQHLPCVVLSAMGKVRAGGGCCIEC